MKKIFQYVSLHMSVALGLIINDISDVNAILIIITGTVDYL